jgi:hypothetical protein
VSQLQSFAKCGEAYRLERVAKAPQRTAAWFVQGTAVHSAIEAYERSYRTLSPDLVAEQFEWYWDLDMARAETDQPDHTMWMVGGRKKRDTDISQRRALGRQQAIDYAVLNTPYDDWLPTELVPGEPAVEVPFTLDLGGVTVIGFIDSVLEHRHTGQLRPRDAKTGTKQPTDPYQLATYKIAVEELTGQTVIDGEWWMCKDGKATDPFPLSRYTREKVAAWYVKMDRSERDGNYLANPGDHCFTCTVKPYCEYVNQYPLTWQEAA